MQRKSACALTHSTGPNLLGFVVSCQRFRHLLFLYTHAHTHTHTQVHTHTKFSKKCFMFFVVCFQATRFALPVCLLEGGTCQRKVLFIYLIIYIKNKRSRNPPPASCTIRLRLLRFFHSPPPPPASSFVIGPAVINTHTVLLQAKRVRWCVRARLGRGARDERKRRLRVQPRLAPLARHMEKCG